ncbi:hypothetical protein [Bacteroides helcogenes]|uniref:Uncharacterized protein n=1 Tax=Bacteroides helcogenes (strain ATCC 35417 / DSM 20613 / JCM 6297 / CCUG 15421 / P 36-108) TaxID=693979 RepID=E6SN99_BACT6|nr:hypothetical protein [Bacteroides helcogenes]ADV44752.1 hypothetical protein Bache_2810 [Bacteroides helcogenes P 36-108]MDY5237326.1 hypothetical protein [Bacteroides helcogenes]
MELVKVNETVTRNYEGGKKTEEVTSISYNIVDNDNVVGSASIRDGHFSMSVQMPGNMAEIKEKVETLLVMES